MKNSFYKILTVVVLIGILYSPVSPIFKTQKINAIFGIGDVTFDPVNLGEMILEWTLKTTGIILKKTILDRLVDTLVNYIKNDGQGAVIQDWEEFFKQAGADAVGLIAQDLGAGFLCGPFNARIDFLLPQPQQFSQQISCSLNDIVGNVENFYKDFKQGGWIAYQEAWLPQNNIYTARYATLNETETKKAEAQKAAAAEGTAGQGFLSYKQCDNVADPKTGEIKKSCRVMTPGKFVGEAATESLLKIPANSILNADDLAGYIGAIVDALVIKYSRKGIAELTGGVSKLLLGKEYCANVKPGDTKYEDCKDGDAINQGNFYVKQTQYLDMMSATLDEMNDDDYKASLIHMRDILYPLTQVLNALVDCRKSRGSTDGSILPDSGSATSSRLQLPPVSLYEINVRNIALKSYDFYWEGIAKLQKSYDVIARIGYNQKTVIEDIKAMDMEFAKVAYLVNEQKAKETGDKLSDSADNACKDSMPYFPPAVEELNKFCPATLKSKNIMEAVQKLNELCK